MSNRGNKTRRRVSQLVLFLLCTTSAVPALAASSDPTANLINLLVKRGVLTKADASGLLKEANSQAAEARRAKTAPAPAAVAPVPAAPSDGAIHVQYVPEIVKQQLREEIKQEVMTQAKDEHWAAPNSVPSWVQRVHVYGDFRARYDGILPGSNDDPEISNFNAINTGAPFDTGSTNNNFEPGVNTTQNRNQFQLRARLGVDADLGDGFTSGMRIATGSSNTPVSENQTFGQANSGQGGNFSKYSIWLDRGFLKYQPIKDATKELDLTVGRFDNPFFSTNLIWADDLGMDGAAISGKYEVRPGFTPFFTAGAFPVFNTDLNFASNQPQKFPSDDKWLYAAQLGAEFKINHDYGVKVAAAYYGFDNISGRLSSPCLVQSSADVCDTDDTRPSFAQNGNTYMSLRNIIPTADNNFGTTDQFQYFGLASAFHELALTGRVDVSHFDPTHLWFVGEFVDNLAYNYNKINAIAVNNRAGSTDPSAPLTNFNGGGLGYFINANFGKEKLEHRWDWNASVGYKWLESDAVVDAFTDPDFGLGGTNEKGYILTGNLALSDNVWTRLRWASADTIAGGPVHTDIVQFDINARF